MLPNELILTLSLAGVAVYFSVLLVRGLAGYLQFRRVRPTALLTWPGQLPPYFPFLLMLGIVSAGLAVLNGYLNSPFHRVYSQCVIALYFILMVPLSARIHLGFYRDGVWSDTGFLPYARIGRLTFRESPEIVLIMQPRGGSRSFRLRVPPGEYGAVRKVLEEKIRDHSVTMEASILGL